MSAGILLGAVAASHRAWFRRVAVADGGGVDRFGGVTLAAGRRSGMVPFPRSRSAPALDALAARVRALELREVGVWSLGEDDVLGDRLVARGFQWGWQPHWMAIGLARLPPRDPAHVVEPVAGPYAPGLPYDAPVPGVAGVHHLGVRDAGVVVGHVVVSVWRGVAGIYSMGVAPTARGQGRGRALTLAACRLGRELGCSHAVLNATPEGERIYAPAGFTSLGHGRTWWLLR